MVTATRQTDVINPYSGDIVGSVPEMDEQAVRDSIQRAYTAAPEMAALPAYKRGAILNNTARLLQENSEELARLMTQENGKPLKYTRGEVSRGIDTFNFAADEARRIHGETIPLDATAGGVGKIGYYVRVPVGLIAAITPFNFPL